MRKTFKKLSLLPAKIFALGVTFALIVFVRLGLSFVGLKNLRRLLPELKDARTASPAEIRRVRTAVTHMSCFVPMATCLTQAYTAQILLTILGCASELQIGVKRHGAFQAHAWLLSGSDIVVGGNQNSLTQYAPITRFTQG